MNINLFVRWQIDVKCRPKRCVTIRPSKRVDQLNITKSEGQDQCQGLDGPIYRQESRAVARKSRDAACYVFRYLKYQWFVVYKLRNIPISILSQLLHSRRSPVFHIPPLLHLEFRDDPFGADRYFFATP